MVNSTYLSGLHIISLAQPSWSEEEVLEGGLFRLSLDVGWKGINLGAGRVDLAAQVEELTLQLGRIEEENRRLNETNAGLREQVRVLEGGNISSIERSLP